MVVFREWIDFVIYPADSQRVYSLDQRLDISNAAVIDLNDPTTITQARERGAVSIKDVIVQEGDEFEAMEIDVGGNVTIWTKQKVWSLHRLHGYGPQGMEKLFYSPRHPPEK